MFRQIVVGLVAGVAFLVLDGVLNANPLAQRLYAAYQRKAASGRGLRERSAGGFSCHCVTAIGR